MESLRFGPPRWMAVFPLIMAMSQLLRLAQGDRVWWRVFLLTVFLLGGLMLTRAEASEFTTEGVRLPKWGLRRRRIPWSMIADLREKHRWQDGARLVLRTGEVVTVPYVARKKLPVLQQCVAQEASVSEPSAAARPI